MKQFTSILIVLFVLLSFSACSDMDLWGNTSSSQKELTENVDSIVASLENKLKDLESQLEESTETLDKSNTTSTVTNSKPSNESSFTHKHIYSNATCTKPASCSCGETKGSALGHPP